MPTPSTWAFGRLARKLVKERRTVQASGKTLSASKSRTVGEMNSQAMARSESPRARRASASGVARAARSTMVSGTLVSFIVGPPWAALGCAERGPARSQLDLPDLLEHLLPVGHQGIQGLLGRALAGHDVVV